MVGFVGQEIATRKQLDPANARVVMDGERIVAKRLRLIEGQVLRVDAFGRARGRDAVPAGVTRQRKVALVIHHSDEHSVFGLHSDLPNYSADRSMRCQTRKALATTRFDCIIVYTT